VTLSRNHSCNRKAKIRFVELHATVNNTKIVSVAQKCFYGEFMLPEKIKIT
jgi:hypothetical protein